jgi:competence protein ComEA
MKLTSRVTAAALAAALLLAALPAVAQGKKVNVNTADVAQLSLLPRVGPSVAQRILEFRRENGPFKRPEDLMLVRGIGEKTFELLKPYLAISGETTLKEKVRATLPSGGEPKPAPAAKDQAPTAKDKTPEEGYR